MVLSLILRSKKGNATKKSVSDFMKCARPGMNDPMNWKQYVMILQSYTTTAGKIAYLMEVLDRTLQIML
jgi:hypothetical protein